MATTVGVAERRHTSHFSLLAIIAQPSAQPPLPELAHDDDSDSYWPFGNESAHVDESNLDSAWCRLQQPVASVKSALEKKCGNRPRSRSFDIKRNCLLVSYPEGRTHSNAADLFYLST